MQVVWLGDPGSDETALVGGKASGLGAAARRWQVPPGFCVVSDGPPHNGAERALLTAAYERLGRELGEDAPAVAVRSSALDEDGEAASFAGQYETVLNVVGPAALEEAVARCFASARANRVVEYRRNRGLGGGAAPISVLVQALVVADAAGIVFTADPVRGDSGRVVVNASWGLGEAVVSGLVTPDMWLLDKAALLDGQGATAIIERHVADKERMTVAVPEGVATVNVPRMLRSVPCLTDDAIVAAAGLALELEGDRGFLCDVECAWRSGRLHLLQCRPVTTVPEPAGTTVSTGP